MSLYPLHTNTAPLWPYEHMILCPTMLTPRRYDLAENAPTMLTPRRYDPTTLLRQTPGVSLIVPQVVLHELDGKYSALFYASIWFACVKIY